MEYMPYVWLGVTLICLVLEAATAQLVSIWFVVGGLAAFITSLIFENITAQLVAFFVASILALVCTRPLAKKILHKQKVHTNADRVIGQTAVVTEEINNEIGSGFVNVAGQIWSARSLDQSIILKNENVQIQSIQGVKLMVLPVKKPE